MEKLTFKSNLTMEEIERNFEGVDLYSELMTGLEEALAFSKGEAYAETFVRKRSLPNINVAEIRESLRMTQKSFASVLGVSRRTVEAWETGKSNPTPTAKKLMHLIREDHTLIEKLT